jgi:hypothetical protein
MADLAGTTKEQVSRILADFEKEQLIRFRAKHFKFMSVDKLRHLAEKQTALLEESHQMEA